MRLAWYAGASTALAAGVIISAFHQRSNFYSAMVHLFQSNLSLIVLVNLTILVYSSFVYGLQRICYGQLRAVEVEQLYDRAWFAVTETCLAMTIFRDEIGGSFIVLFVALLTGKVWGWIGEGRVEALEQQPPANPRLFHTRLSVSLLLSLVYDVSLLRYAVMTVVQAARADMMVMFLFEFAVLSITSCHTAMRYAIVLIDSRIIRSQTQERLHARRRQVREERAAEIARRLAAGEPEDGGEPLPDEDDVDEMDIEVPGWEAKGQYILGLDLWTDFVKLCLYATFFFVLVYIYGLPLHIIRDLFLTVRSFIKRLGALMKYRQAMREMNRHPDATAEELTRENTCIICREDMHVWDPNDPTTVERSRPKKLPCGHILHLGCLKSWMERQQVCPTCRRPVVVQDEHPQNNRNGDAVLLRFGINIGGDPAGNGAAGPGAAAAPGGGGGAVPPVDGGAQGNHAAPPNGMPMAGGPPPHGMPQFPAHGQPAGAAGGAGAAANVGLNGGGPAMRMFNFGPLRLGFAQGRIQNIQQMAQGLGLPAGVAGAVAGAAGAAGPGAGAGAGAGADAGAAGGAGGAGAGYPFAQFPTQPAGFTPLPGYGTFGPHPINALAPDAILADIQAIERRIDMVMQAMQSASAETQLMRLVVTEYQRTPQGQSAEAAATSAATTSTSDASASAPASAPVAATSAATSASVVEGQQPVVSPSVAPSAGAVPGGHSDGNTHNSVPPAIPPTPVPAAVHLTTHVNALPVFPAGLQIPPGWSLIPMQRVDNGGAATATTAATAASRAESTSSTRAQHGSPEPSIRAEASNSGEATPARSLSQSLDPTAATTSTQAPITTAPSAAASTEVGASSTWGTHASEAAAEQPPNWGGSAQLFGVRTLESSNSSSSGEGGSGDDHGNGSDSSDEA